MTAMQRIPFLKMHGCGNDYVYIDAISNPVSYDLSRLAMNVSDRHRSVGGDGLVLMLPSATPTAAARMRMFNADGSEGSLCGNALRCMALWLHQTNHAGNSFQIEMGSRLIDVTIIASNTDNGSGIVRVQIGKPVAMNPDEPSRAQYVKHVDSR
jgi:diaminopimelate epimerase